MVAIHEDLEEVNRQKEKPLLNREGIHYSKTEKKQTERLKKILKTEKLSLFVQEDSAFYQHTHCNTSH